MKRIILTLSLSFAFYSWSAPVQAEFSSEWYDWLMFHYGIGRTGYNDGTKDFYPPLGEKWRSSIIAPNNDIRSSPAILDNALYTGGLGDLPDGGWFYRLNADNGSVIWKYNTGAEIHSSPAIADNGTNGRYVYVGASDGKFYCFSGTETFLGTNPQYIWMFDTNGAEIYSSPVVWNGLVYFTAKKQQKGYIYCLSGTSSASIWTTQVDGETFYSSPAISEKDNLVYVGDENGFVYALDANFGTLTWKYDTGVGPISASPVYKDGVVYIASEDGNVYVLDSKGVGTTTTLLWSYDVKSPIKSTPAIADNCLFFGADDSYVYAVNPPIQTGTQTGTETLLGSLRWKHKTNRPVVSSPAIAGGVVYVGSNDGYLYGLDMKGAGAVGTETVGTATVGTTSVIWSTKLGEYAVSSPAIARRMLYVAGGDGNVFAFERKPLFSVSKFANLSEVNPGGTLTYTISFKNTGYVGSGVYVRDQLDSNLGIPGNVSIFPAKFDNWTYSGGVITWNIGTVSSMDYGTLTFDCQVSQSACGTITNTAVLYCNELPSISTSTRTQVGYFILRKSVDSSYVQPSGTLTYTIEYKSPIVSLNSLIIEDLIPGSSTYIPSSAKGEGMSILYSHNGSWDKFDNAPVSAIKWTRGDFGTGYVGTASFKVLVDQYVDDGKILINIASATTTTDGGSLTATSSVSSLVTSGPVIEMAKFVGNGFKEVMATYLSVATYTISYSAKFKKASGVFIVDKVPSGVSYISRSAKGSGTIKYSSDGVNYYLSETNPVLFIKWELGNLDKGSSGTGLFSVVVGDVDDGDVIKNYATATSLEKGPFVSDSALIIVSANPKLTLTKTTDVASTPDSTLTYTLSYANSKKNAENVIIIDKIPLSSIYISKSATGTYKIEYSTDTTNWELFETNPVGYIRWTIGSLNKSSSGSISFKVKLDSNLDDGTIIENTGIITDQTQIVTSTFKTQVSSKPFFTIIKQASTSTVAFGDILTYTIDYRLLCKDTTNIEIIDKIPTELTFEGIDALGSITYSHDNGLTYDELIYLPITHVKIRRDALQRNGTGTIRLVTKLIQNLNNGTIITNRATITAKEAETKTAQTLVRVSSISKLTGSLTVSPSGPIAPRWLLTYTINYQNIGSISARNVVIQCDADKNPYLTNIAPLNGGSIEPNTIVWNVGTVPTGASGNVSFTAYVSSNIQPNTTINVSGWIIASGDVFLALNSVSSSAFEPFDSFCNAWSMFGRDPVHSHYAADETLYPPLKVEKSIDVNGGIFSSPAIGENGVVYFATDKGVIYALGSNGNPIWESYQTNDSFHSSPAVAGTDNTFLYIGGKNYPGYLYCFNASTGAECWKYPTKSHIYTSPVVKYGIVYFGDDDGRIYALGATDGALIWVYNTGHQKIGQFSSPVVENGVVYIGSKNKSLYSFDAFSGAPRWAYATGGEIVSSPAFADGIVYTGSDDGYLYALRAGTQSSLLWRYNVISPIQSSPAIAYGKVYFGAENGMVYALNQGGTSSSLSWSYQTQGRVFSSPAIANGVIYIGSDDGYLYCLDANSGSFIARYYIGGGIISSPAIEGGRVFIGSAHSKLYFFVEAPELSGTKTASVSEVKPGGTITYTITYKNNAYVGATGVEIVDSLSQDLGTPTNIKPTATYYPGSHTVIWNLETLSGKREGSVQFDVAVNQSAVSIATITNKAVIKSNEVLKETNPVDVAVIVPTLSITKSVDLLYATPNSTLTYTISISNKYKDATNVQIIDTIPQNTTYILNSSSGTGTIEYWDNGWVLYQHSGITKIRWTIPGLSRDVSSTLGFRVVISGTVSDGTIITNTASVTATGADTKTFTSITYISSKPILSIKKSLDVKDFKEIKPDGTLTYVIVYGNNARDASDFEIIDTLSTLTTTYIDNNKASATSGVSVWYSPDGGINYYPNLTERITHIKWMGDTLKKDDVGTITLRLRINSNIKDGTIITNIVSMKSKEIISSITSSVSAYVISKPELSSFIITTTPTGTVSEGWLIKYEITYGNTGNITAEGVSIEVDLDKYLTNVTIGEGGTGSNGIIIWNIGTVGVGGEGKRTFSAFIKKPILSQDKEVVVSVTIMGSNIEKPVKKSVISSLVPPINSESDEWPMLGFSPSHSGYNPKEFIMTQKLGLVGSVSLSFQIFAPPVINNNRVYVSCKGSGALYSFDKDGKELWKYPARVYSTPAIADNKIFFTDEDGYLHCLNEQGSPIFSKLYIGLGLSSPVVVNGIVYITSSRAIFAISAFNGTMLWSYVDIERDIYSSPAVSDGILYIGTDKGNVYFLDQATGELKASPKVSGRIYSSLAIDGEIAYFGAGDGRLYGIEQYGTGTREVLNLSLGSPINSTPAIYNDTIYIGADNGRLYAIDISGSGTTKWEFLTGGRIKSQCAIANALFFTSEDGYLYSLNLDNGEMLFTYKIGKGCGVSLANGRVYAVSNNKLWIFGSVPNLQVLISSSPSNFVVSGETITYTIKYENKGQDEAIDTKVVVSLDSNLGIPFDILNEGTWSYISGTKTIIWKLGTIFPSESGILTFKCQVHAARTTKIKVQGEIMANNNLPYKTNIVGMVGDQANLILTINPSTSIATLNEVITYNISYFNKGDFPVDSVNITVNKPHWTTYIQNSTRHNGIPLSDTNGKSPIFTGISITRLNGLMAGSITFNVKVNIDYLNGKTLTTQGTISAILAQETPLSTSVTSIPVLIEAPSLWASESVLSPVRPGDSVPYTITYQNTGSRSAYNLIITEKLSRELTIIPKSILENGEYSSVYSMITWILGELKPGEVGTIAFNVKSKPVLDNGFVIRNNAYIEATNIPRREISSATLIIQSSPNLSLSTMYVYPNAGVNLGSVVRYDINVSNTGNMDAEGVIVYDRLPQELSISKLTTKGEVIEGDGRLDIDDINGWSGFDNGKVDGTIQIVTNQGVWRSSPINTFNYPSIQSLMTEINSDNKANVEITYDEFDRFTIKSKNNGGYIKALEEEGTYPFFTAAKIQVGNYCTGTWTNGVISWNLGTISGGYGSKTISFSAQVVDNGQIINYATITSANHSTVTTNMAEITVDKNPPTLIGRPKEDSSDLGADYDFLDDDVDIDGIYRVVFPIESEPCGLIEYEIAERIGTGSWVIIGTSRATASFYEGATRTKGLTYTYRIKARNAVGWGKWSEISDGIKIVDVARVVSCDKDLVISQDNLSIKIPKGAFPGTVTFTIQKKNIGIKAASPAISSILPNSIYEFIVLSEKCEETQPTKTTFTLTLPYEDLDLANETDDLSYRVYKLIGAQWVLVDGPQIVDTAKNTVQCTLYSLSIYGVGSPVGLSLSNVIIQPNPFKDKHDRIQFFGLTNGRVDISIFNIAGELILKREVPGPLWDWNLLNDKGKKVSSGIYIAVIDDGKEKVIRRFAIIK